MPFCAKPPHKHTTQCMVSPQLVINSSAPTDQLCECLATSSQIELYDVQGSMPSVRYVHLREEAKGAPTSLALEDALPLQHLLAPVATCKDSIAAAVDALQPSEAALQSTHASSSLGPCSFGAALQAVLG